VAFRKIKKGNKLVLKRDVGPFKKGQQVTAATDERDGWVGVPGRGGQWTLRVSDVKRRR
jgi:hypothetical protein